jgi:leucyl-tRNA synthetase
LPRYDPQAIEPVWQAYWLSEKTFKTPNPGEPGFDPAKPKYYVLDMFPYPSADGLHVGHPEGQTATDIIARYKRMKGFNVLHPMGWDSFGLPAEQYAIKTGQHPAITTATNIDRFRSQEQRLGFSFDWDREIATSHPDYYRWTQWIFEKLYEKGLAYQAEVPVWWCEGLGTVLANEEVDSEGKSERGGFPCVRKNMRQWMLKITAYAQRLLDDLEGLDWPPAIKKMQADWIGRSEGADVDFKVADGPAIGENLRIFTTRPDTLFGATYMVLAPEHPLVDKLATGPQRQAVLAYREAAARKSERERQADVKEKTGAFTGSHAANPVNGQKIPIWVADYVLATYGTGAIMAVPGHDERDFAFATTMKLPIVEVVRPPKPQEGCFAGDGVAINSGPLDGLETPQAKQKILQILEEKKVGTRVVRFKLRDWLFSRQRYWGEPFPIVFDAAGKTQVVPENQLPVALPELESFQPSGNFEPPLSRAKAWVDSPLGRRETNVMPQWAGSCWYFLRFLDARNERQAWDQAIEKYWMPVDLYIGGAEHAVLHLLYARFWHKFFFDLGLVSTKEPFQKLYNQGMIGGQSFKTRTGVVVKTADVKWVDGKPVHPETSEPLEAHAAKMSKSLGNVINPDTVVAEYGADSLRLYEMFMGPLDAGKVWDTNSISGVYRFLKRIWHLVTGEEHAEQEIRPELKSEKTADPKIDRALHRCLKKVTEDIEGLNFNTAISAMMIFLNEVGPEGLTRKQAKTLALMVSPLAPHLGEELWKRLGHDETLAYEPWPAYDPALCQDSEVELVVQINGKVRSKLTVLAAAGADDLKALALKDGKVLEALNGGQPKKVIVVPGKLVNVVL